MVTKSFFSLLFFMTPLLFLLVFFADDTSAADSSSSLTDKTLVAWISLESLTQKGGSVLTLEQSRGTFDALVFGEIKPARWMAGSNVFARTQRDQENYPTETAEPGTLVQMALVYKGKQITLYRNGKLYARYDMASDPVSFTSDTLVLLGRRHLDAHNPCFFAGSIDDARIYSQPLDAKTISSLKPNVLTGPQPLAWWSFANGRAEDLMKTFPGAYLAGGARITDGKLHLDGRDAYMIAGVMLPKLTVDQKALAQTGRNLRSFREKMLQDRYRPGYHFVAPEGIHGPFDPNGAIFWKGRYHLFYIYAGYGACDWAHVSSVDLLHWRHHPTGLTKGMFSGNCFLNKDGLPTMCYHQVGIGNSLAVTVDDELNYWKKLDSNPITPKTKSGDEHHGKYRSWDPYGWLEGDTYYAIFGGKRPGIVKSKSMAGPWKYVGDLFAHGVEGVSINEDVSCADLFKIGDKYMLLCISHRLGARYYLGQWKNEQFYPEYHEKMSWVDNSFFAPESLLDNKGRRIMWAWITDLPGIRCYSPSGWSGTMSLPRVLSLGKDGMLRMRPPRELNRLRYNPRREKNLTLAADTPLPLKNIRGDSFELLIEMIPGSAQQCGVTVCASPDGSEQTLIYYDTAEKKLKIDTRKSSLKHGTKSIEAAPFFLKNKEKLKLRVYVDKSVIEVFANNRQAVMRRIYPTRDDSVNMSLFSKGGSATVPVLRAWDMMPSNPY